MYFWLSYLCGIFFFKWFNLVLRVLCCKRCVWVWLCLVFLLEWWLWFGWLWWGKVLVFRFSNRLRNLVWWILLCVVKNFWLGLMCVMLIVVWRCMVCFVLIMSGLKLIFCILIVWFKCENYVLNCVVIIGWLMLSLLVVLMNIWSLINLRLFVEDGLCCEIMVRKWLF